MSTSKELKSLSLGEVLTWAHREVKKEISKKSEISHAVANCFMSELIKQGVRILETGKGNANYFFMEVDRNTWGISPFASDEE